MNRQNAFSEQEAMILKKKRELELKRKASAENDDKTKVFKSEDSSSRPLNRSLSSFSRHKALLRSGLIGKSKIASSGSSASSKSSSSSSISDCFEAPEPKEPVVKVPLKTEAEHPSSAATAEDPPPNTESGDAQNAAWFKEALERARQKAQAANTSSVPSSKRSSRWEAPSAPSTAAVGAAFHPSLPPTAPVVPGLGGVRSLSVPSNIMNMVHEGEHLDAIKGVMLTRLTRSSPAIVAYAQQVFGSTEHLTEDQWKQCQDQIKMNVVFQLLQAKQAAADKREQQGKVKFEYDSDEDTEGGTWEHKRRKEEMEKTRQRAEELSEMGAGKHHIGDFLPPEELQKFMEKFCAIREGRDPDFSDYRSNKLTDDNIGYKMLKSMGWTEGQGLGPAGKGITEPVNQNGRSANHGLGIAAPDGLSEEDNEYDAYRKRMMLSYRFRPNPLNNPRRPYY
ncbi:SURP and G-patch domain-containing protein 1 isoform X2 [Hyalella azteca]|uniref:SURP and G-patch domain-containing protein 1 isoform X2 n=1 Tax=Hyalella azteca TaxID=294128 RepID=A0A8B7PI49_HYAAZ|nr:SURP and G-patch domain-containing protein 1 isoform X2 [Hyalella azteca]